MCWLLFSVLVSVTCISGHSTNDFPFRNTSLPWDERVTDLVHRLTLAEMVLQMAMGGGATGKPSPAIPRLGILAYQWDTECLHGVVLRRSTAFPQALGLAASFSGELVYAVAEVIATEVRAIHNDAMSRGQQQLCQGLSCFAPFINILRHPLWGRVQEVNSEDPYLSGILAAAYVKGLHGSHPKYVRASSGCKVVGLYSGPENIPESRFSFNAIASERDLRLSYFPQFKACIDAGTFNLMCSFYSLNGIPGCTHKWLLTDVMRNEYGFKGYYVTDWGALDTAIWGHKYFNSTLYSAAAAANAGINLELPDAVPAFLRLTEAVQKGLVTMDTIVELVKPLFYTRMRLGEFDPPIDNPYAAINLSVIESDSHRELAAVAATKTFVLLKNLNGILPIKSKLNTLSVIGPMSDNLAALYGNYQPALLPEYGSTPLKGLTSLASNVQYAEGCDNIVCKKYNSSAVKQVAAAGDIVIVCLGTGTDIETEGHDRSTLDLPGHQMELLLDAIDSAKKPIVLLLFTGGPVNISVAKTSPKVGAILQCFFPAQATGVALHRVLAVDTAGHVVSPAARMPYTWPTSLNQVPPMLNYSMEGRTYRYFHGTPLYSFGYGLSYANFEYSKLIISPLVVKAGTNVTVTVTVLNTGPYDSDEVVQLYIGWLKCPVEMPQRQLVAVHRTLTTVNQHLTLNLTIHAEQMRIWDDKQEFIFYAGTIDVFVGGQQPNQETAASSNVLHGQFNIDTNTQPVKQDRQPVEQDKKPVEHREPVEQGRESVKQDKESVNQNWEPVEQGLEPVEQGLEPVEQGMEPVEQGLEPVNQDVDNDAGWSDRLRKFDVSSDRSNKPRML